MNKKINIFLGILLFILIGLIVLKLSAATGDLKENNFANLLELEKGKNLIKLNESIYAAELINLNSYIESISYFDEFLNRTVGYINIFGGVGDNFLIESDKIYEISSSKNATLVIYRG